MTTTAVTNGSAAQNHGEYNYLAEKEYTASLAAHTQGEPQPQQTSADQPLLTESLSDAEGDDIESWMEERVLNSRFLTLAAVVGALAGAALCFFKGSILVLESIRHYLRYFVNPNTSREILYLVEALDVYLMGTVMLIFGIGLYELFIGSLHFPNRRRKQGKPSSPWPESSLFGHFPLRSRPKWLAINSLDEMKTKVGHVIVMILLVGMFEKSKKVVITSAVDFLCFSGSIALAALCLFLLSKLHTHEASQDTKASGHH